MAEQEQEQTAQVEEHEEDDNPNYKTPAPKALDEIVNADADDESLRKYKEALLGKSATEQIVIDPDKNKVIVKKMTLVIPDRDPMCLDLTQTAEELKALPPFVLKEACHYKIKIDFNVQKDIVTGLKYEHKVYRKGVRVDSLVHMLGSYGPNKEEYIFLSSNEEAPKGLVSRGDYKIKSKFVDDDKFIYASWEWNLSIKKDW